MRKRVRAARTYGWPREWVLSAALAEAARLTEKKMEMSRIEQFPDDSRTPLPSHPQMKRTVAGALSVLVVLACTGAAGAGGESQFLEAMDNAGRHWTSKNATVCSVPGLSGRPGS